MKKKLWKLALCIGLGVAWQAVPLKAGEDTRELLDLLVKKGVISHEEAGDLAQKIETDSEASKEASKLKVSNGVMSMTIFGDARVRYEMRDGQSIAVPGAPGVGLQTPGTRTRDRYRYMVHAGVKGDLTDKFFYEFRLTTNNNPRSPNVTFNDDTTGFGPGSKDSDKIYVDHVFLGWKPNDYLTFIAGRQANPLYTTSMVWDSDIAPEGLTEQFSVPVDGYKVFGTFGQYVYSDTSDAISGAGFDHTDTLLLPFQVGASGQITKDVGFKIAPTFYVYVGHDDPLNGVTSANKNPVPFTTGYGSPVAPNSYLYASPQNTGTQHLAILEIPMELNFSVHNIPFRPYANFAINTDAGTRAERAGRSDKGDQNLAYQIGMEIGSTKKKGDWDFNGWWQHVEAFALDPNLVDADIFDSRVNMEGFAVSAKYFFTDNVWTTVTYANGDRIDNTLGNAASQGDLTDINPLGNYHLLQCDLNWKF